MYWSEKGWKCRNNYQLSPLYCVMWFDVIVCTYAAKEIDDLELVKHIFLSNILPCYYVNGFVCWLLTRLTNFKSRIQRHHLVNNLGVSLLCFVNCAHTPPFPLPHFPLIPLWKWSKRRNLAAIPMCPNHDFLEREIEMINQMSLHVYIQLPPYCRISLV